MRWVIVVVWLAAGAFWAAGQAHAHADDDHHRSAATHHDAADGDATDYDHRRAHNPSDHRHPLGEDPFHEMAAHGMADVAAHHEPAVQRAPSSVALSFPLMHERAEGIAHAPPVPPPLG